MRQRIGRAASSVFTAGLLSLMLALASPAAAQSPALIDAQNTYKALDGQGRYAEAEVHAKEAVRLAAQEFGTEHDTYAITLGNLAGLYRA